MPAGFPHPPNPTHYKQGLCVNQSTLITVLPTIPPASYKATGFITDPKHFPKNHWVFYQQAMLLLGKTPDISPSGDSSGAQPAPGTSSPPFPLPPCLAWLISSSSSPAQAGAVPSQTIGSSRNTGRELPAQASHAGSAALTEAAPARGSPERSANTSPQTNPRIHAGAPGQQRRGVTSWALQAEAQRARQPVQEKQEKACS